VACEEADLFQHLPRLFDLAEAHPEHLGDPRRFAVAIGSALPSAII
jgi:hypothetical protein